MKYFIPMMLVASYVVAQTCPVPIPSVPPKAIQAYIRFTNPDGGSRPCEITGVAAGGQPPKWYPVAQGNRCDVAKDMADQAVANDNGWNDGGSP